MQDGDNLVSVYKAPTEAVANIVAGLLDSEGIDTTIITSATTWGERAAVVDSLERRQSNYWGCVVVAECDVIRSREVISAYQPEEESGEEKPQLNWEKSYSTSSLRIPCALMALILFAIGLISRYGDALLQISMAFTGAFFTTLYAWWIISSSKYVPQQYLRYHKALGYYVFAGAMLLLFIGLWSTETIPISKNAIMIINIIATIAFIYCAVKKYPSQQDNES